MFCQYQYYRMNTEELQTAVDHSDGKYQCKEMSDCPYTGTTVINNIPWGDDWLTEESDTCSEEDREEEVIIEEPVAHEMEENVEMTMKEEDGETEMMEEKDKTRASSMGTKT